MRRFAELYDRLDRTNSTNDKVAAIVAYLEDAPAEDAEPEVQASMNSLAGAFMPAVGEDYENEAAKEAERVRLSQAAEQAEARARAEHAQRLEEAQRQYAAQQQAAQTAALERAKAEALAQAQAQAAAKAAADAAAAAEDASPETATHTPMHAEAAELIKAYDENPDGKVRKPTAAAPGREPSRLQPHITTASAAPTPLLSPLAVVATLAHGCLRGRRA